MNNEKDFSGCVGVIQHSKGDWEFFPIESQWDWELAETILIGDQGNFTGMRMEEGMFSAFKEWKALTGEQK